MTFDPTRLYTALLNTGLQSKDNPLYQVIHDLIANLAAVSKQTPVISSSSSGGLSFAQIAARILIDELSAGSGSGSGLAGATGATGPQGIQGIPGAAGVSIPGMLVNVEENIEDIWPLLPPTDSFAEISVFRTTSQSVTSSTALVNDDTLQISLSPGKYRFSVVYNVSTGANAGGMRAAINFSGTIVNISVFGGFANTNAGGASFGGSTTLDGLVINSGLTTSDAITYMTGTIVVSVAGTIIVRFAQSSSNVSPITVASGSRLTVKRAA